MEIGRNILLSSSSKPHELILTINLETIGPSSTGDNHLIATSGGPKPLGGSGATMTFNLFTKQPGVVKLPPTLLPVSCGEKVSYFIQGGKMQVFLDLSTCRPSSSGKNMVLC